MDFIIKNGINYKIYFHQEESEAVKIAIGNLKKDLDKIFSQIKEVEIEEIKEIKVEEKEIEEVEAEKKEIEEIEAKKIEIEAEKIGTAVKNTINQLKEEEKEKKSQEVQKEQKLAEIIIGTLGISEDILSFIDPIKMQDKQGKLHKEAYIIKVCEEKLIIAGSDRRGTIYGIYDFCEQIGVSPWYFWADVPYKTKDKFCLSEDYEKIDYPSVEYRGIFINDEEELEAWVQKHMGEDTIGVKTYEKIFELLLRLKANYIWPAMHVNSFNLKKENGALANRMGIVVGTSHCDMLMRSNNREWIPWITKKGYQDAVYDYSIPGRNREILQEYWQESVEQNKDFEVSYTMGMRGIHDSGFETKDLEGKTEEEKKQAKVELLEKIINDQSEILQNTLKQDTMKTFIPYKEVLDLYDNGLKIPEDITLIWANDNYGYIRRYPSEKEKKRAGGNGIYYHNSYWAPPSMSYVFLCSIPLAHTRNELKKAYDEGIRKLWVLNSGAIKPLEQEITFFLRFAWEVGKKDALTDNVDNYVEDWINRTFQGEIGSETAELLNDFSQLTNVRKLENMDYDAFSQTAYGDEAVVRIHKYEELFEKGNAIYQSLAKEERDAFFQLVLMRIHAAYFTNLQFYYGDRSTLVNNQGKKQAAAYYTKKAIEFDDARRRMLVYYNQIMANGKWDKILNPEGFPPPRAAMMSVCTPPLTIGERKMIVTVWNEAEEFIFRKPGIKWLEIANAGEGEFAFKIQAPNWVYLSEESGTVKTEKRILITIENTSQNCQGEIKIYNLTDKKEETIKIKVLSLQADVLEDFKDNTMLENISIEEDGIVCIEADSAQSPCFKKIERLGRGQGNIMEACVNKELLLEDGEDTTLPLTYWVYFSSGGQFQAEIHRFPSLNSTGRIRFGVSIDKKSIQIAESFSTDEWRANWKENVLNNVDRMYVTLPQVEPGVHKISIYAIDKYAAFSRLVIYTEKRKENNFIGITGNQALPYNWDTEKWQEEFYGKISLQPRPVAYAPLKASKDNLIITSTFKYPKEYANKVQPKWYLEEGKSIFTEKAGIILIDAASVLSQSKYAYTETDKWQYCNSESYGRSGLAMYIREPHLKWENPLQAPSLNYQFMCTGGQYIIWMLSKFNQEEESYFALGIDGNPLPLEELYCQGCLIRYEAEQIYRWVPAAVISLTKGEHILQVYALASGMRYDRFYLTKGKELPPLDTEWKK